MKKLRKVKPVSDKDFYAVKNEIETDPDTRHSQVVSITHFSSAIPKQYRDVCSLALYLNVHQSGEPDSSAIFLLSLSAAQHIADSLNKTLIDYKDSLTR